MWKNERIRTTGQKSEESRNLIENVLFAFISDVVEDSKRLASILLPPKFTRSDDMNIAINKEE